MKEHVFIHMNNHTIALLAQKSPQFYTQVIYSRINISTAFSTLSTIRFLFFHKIYKKNQHNNTINHSLCTGYPQFVYKYGCSC